MFTASALRQAGRYMVLHSRVNVSLRSSIIPKISRHTGSLLVNRNQIRRWYASEDKDADALIRSQKFVETIGKNPEVMEAINSLNEMLLKKSLLKPNAESISPFAMMKMMLDTEVKGQLAVIAQLIKKHKIDIRQEDITQLMEILKIKG